MRGATTTTSWPVEAATRASAAMPGARTPSSVVTSIRTGPPVCDHPRCVGGELVRRRGLPRLPYDSATDLLTPTTGHEPTPLPVTATGMQAPSGAQYDIGHGRHQLVVAEVGATIRSYTVDGTAVVDGFGVDQMCDSGR